MGRFLTIVSFQLVFILASGQIKKDYEVQSIAFYNVENLFDIFDNPETFDDDRTPSGKDVWNQDKYSRKLSGIGKVLSEIGRDVNPEPPSIIGLCEIENRAVLEDLIKEPALAPYSYKIVHFDSPDERGIDVALLYRAKYFTPLNSQPRRLILYEKDNPSKRDYTRDQLVVTGLLNNEEISFIVNHWPSRGGGEARSAYKREKAAILNKRIIDSLFKINPETKIISMGDFNDDPTNNSFKKILKTKSSTKDILASELYNPMENMMKKGAGSLAYRDSWNLFDQFYMTGNLVNYNHEGYQFYHAGIFNKAYLITQSGQFKGYPLRTYGYSGYEGGYSDHFPVYIYLIREK
ncbi:endonuclease [Christiangramia salexigens]|uniref:Endonuclease n=1 Tax=Christiangramia salexigens TaxID=1913577 RepID=A0A1L3J8J2_9FLAO|nr:endonuclease [Christiangramia salexigens]